MKPLAQDAFNAFKKHYGYHPQYLIQAPGRVNLIGEHTDYNDGFVLPCAIDYSTIIASAKRSDQQINIYANNFQEEDHFSLSSSLPKNNTQLWANYIRGVIVYLKEVNPNFQGCDLLVNGNIPLGSGLSSSAALEVSIATTFKTLYNLPIPPKEIALLCQKAENKFVGCNCGIMDQFISTLGEKDHALLIDCRNLTTQSIPIPPDISIVIINSNVQHGLVDSEYNLRRQQCEAASKILNISKLRDATLEQLEAHKSKMSEIIYRRARHIITENNRTLAAAKALSRNDLKSMAQLMHESHQSMKNDFEITVPPIDYLVNLIQQESHNQIGVRMTGGGFGGCVVALVPNEQVNMIQKLVSTHYFAKTGLHESFYICHASQGANIIPS